MGTDPDFPRAGLWRRLAALLYDCFLVGAIWMLLGYVVELVAGTDSNRLVDGRVQTDPVVDAILFSLMLLSAAGFYIWFWTRNGQTLGMLAWRMQLQSTRGGPVSWHQGLLRCVAAWPSFFLLGIGYLWMYFDGDGDAFHDKLSQTRVVVLPKSASLIK